MKSSVKIITISAIIFLSGCCGGIFESKTCGVKQSAWDRMSTTEQLDIEKSYHEKLRLSDQAKTHKLEQKQQKHLAKTRKKQELAQEKRLKKEQAIIKKQQQKTDYELKLKQNAYMPIEVTPEE